MLVAILMLDGFEPRGVLFPDRLASVALTNILIYVYLYIMEAVLKPVRWVGSSLDDLRSFPPEVRKEIGNALYTAQKGYSDPAAKPLKGFSGASVLEIRALFDGDDGARSIPSE